jgi:predicted nucleotidyltransferase
MKRKNKNTAKLIKNKISEIDINAQVILFGSRARGDERSDSDWDLLILTDYQVSLEKEREFRRKLYELELELGESFSIFAYSKTDWTTKQRITPFYFNVNRDGIQL